MSSLFLETPAALMPAALLGKDAPAEYTSLWECKDSITVAPQQPKRTVQTRLTRKFEGDNWKPLVEGAPELLRQTFVCEACVALNVLPSAIQNVELRLGSLYVTFHVSHDEEISQEEMDQMIEEYPFREMWRLYNQRDGAVDGLDAAFLRIKEFEEKLAATQRDLDQEYNDHDRDVKDLKDRIDAITKDLTSKANEREADLIKELTKAQGSLKDTRDRLRASEEEAKKLLEALKREKTQAEKTAKQHFDLVNAIIQENKKEKEAKDREFMEAIEEKDNTIRSLLERLTDRNSADISMTTSCDMDHGDKVSQLRKQVEEMSVLLEKARRGESEGLVKIQKLAENLKRSEEARESESISYENDRNTLQLQIKSFKDTQLAENMDKRIAENRSLRGTSGSADGANNATIMQQYMIPLENLIGSMQDRLGILKNEYDQYLVDSKERMANGHALLAEYEKKSESVRHTFRTCSADLDKVLRGVNVSGVSGIIKKLTAASTEAEQSSAAVKVTLSRLEMNQQECGDQADWLEGHLKTVNQLIESLQILVNHSFERQLLLMNGTAGEGAKH